MIKAFVLTLAVATGSSSVSLSFDVDRRGLKFTGPCQASLYKRTASGPARVLSDSVTSGLAKAPLLRHRDLSEPVDVPRGKYVALLTCPSTEGKLSHVVEVNAKGKRATVKAKLDPGFALIKVARDKRAAAAELRFYDEHGILVQRGFDKIPLPMMPGKYRVIATLKKDKDARQTGRREIKGGKSITVRRGKKTSKTIDLSDGKIKVALFHNGRRAAGAGTLYLPGTRQEVGRVTITERETRGVAPPGVYDLVTRLDDSYDFAEQKKKRLKIVAGKTAKATLRHKTGGVVVTLKRDGKIIDGDVELKVPGALSAFNTITAGERAILAPGDVEVLASRAVGVGSVSAKKRVKIRHKKTTKITLDLSSSTLKVTGTLGGAAPKPQEKLMLELIDDGNVVARKRVRGAPITLELAARRYGLRLVLEAEQGHLEVRKEITMKRGKDRDITLDLALGRVLVQAFQGGVSVAAEVGFLPPNKKEPFLRAPAGQDVYLPPGAYALVLGKGLFTRKFSPIKVVAGADIVRQLEVVDESGAIPKTGTQKRKKRLGSP